MPVADNVNLMVAVHVAATTEAPTVRSTRVIVTQHARAPTTKIVHKEDNTAQDVSPTLTELTTHAANATRDGQELTAQPTQDPAILAVTLATDPTTLTVKEAVPKRTP